ncbi:MAG: hypothetical protein J0H57_17840, partial [Rhodospirillales bacterium]|nr:hypothetical protein [Rhodospirillales bacterium]
MARDEPDGRMKRRDYEAELEKLQVELCHLQQWVQEYGARVIILFEGRDAAGKGGTIKAITEKVSSRVFRVVALPAPSDRERTQLFMQRYMQNFPAGGENPQHGQRAALDVVQLLAFGGLEPHPARRMPAMVPFRIAAAGSHDLSLALRRARTSAFRWDGSGTMAAGVGRGGENFTRMAWRARERSSSCWRARCSDMRWRKNSARSSIKVS